MTKSTRRKRRSPSWEEVMDNKKIAVIGGGAAGLMASCIAAELGATVTVFERNDLLAMKLGITGKGRCNLTNSCSPEEFVRNVTQNGKFLFSAIHRFTPQDTIDYFEALGVPLKVERGNRVFPVSDRATDIVLALKNHMLDLGCRVIHERVTALESENNSITAVLTEKHRYAGFDSVILCTGGVSYPVTGSTGDGFVIAKALGHTVTELIPSLVGLTCAGDLCARMQGLTLKNIAIKIIDKEKNSVIYEDFGELLFTHFGVSGPVILSASAHMRPMTSGKYEVIIDEKPALDEETLDRRLLSEFDKNKNKHFSSVLATLLPSKMIMPFCDICGVRGDRVTNSITKTERKSIVASLKAIKLTVTGFRPISEAIVTGGGVSVSEISPQTMRSKLIKNLYFAGEIIDVDAYTGGFNLQSAFATAVTAATDAAKI